MDKKTLMKLPISLQETEIISKEILEGKWGKDGERFVSTIELAEKRNVSVVTAHKILNEICEKNLIELKGKKYFLSYNKELEMREKKRRIIGLVVTNINNEYFSHIASELEKQAKAKEYKLIICESGYDFEREKEIIDMFKSLKVMGIVSCPGLDERTYEIYKNLKIPYVFLGRELSKIQALSIQINHFSIAGKVAEHLYNNGYREFAYVGINEFNSEDDLRLLGFKTKLKNLGYKLKNENIFDLPVKDYDSKSSELEEFLKNHKKPLGVFCFHDLIALNVMRLCSALKLKIGTNIGIVGVDNLEISRNITPPMTTVDDSVETLAEMGFQKLLNNIENKEKEKINYFIEPKLIVRKSSILK